MKAFAEIARRADDAEGLSRRAWTGFVVAECFDQLLRLQAAFAEHFIDEPTWDAALRQRVDFRLDRLPFVMGERQFRMVARLAFKRRSAYRKSLILEDLSKVQFSFPCTRAVCLPSCGCRW